MAETAPGRSNTIESPANKSTASETEKQAPHKYYPGSANLVKNDGGKPGATMDSPAPQHGYTKK